ncbi:MAG TPA: ABC transporter permease subunit [Streptosporangiaceae bacterium]|nr:ABC transporter permease subunit [Streptosporangiaceae bacterium]
MLNPAIASITLRAALGRRRALLYAIPSLILVGVSAILRLTSPSDPSWPAYVLGTFGFSVVLPLTALIIGTSVLGAEVDDGSVIHVLATPVPRRVIVTTKFVVAAVATMVFAAVPELLAGLIAGQTRLAVGLFAGALAAAVVYNALFVSLSTATSRALVAGLTYVVLWEGVLANVVGGARILSVSHYGLAVAGAIAPGHALRPGVGLVAACVLGAVITAGTLAAAVRRLGSFTLRGETG